MRQHRLNWLNMSVGDRPRLVIGPTSRLYHVRGYIDGMPVLHIYLRRKQRWEYEGMTDEWFYVNLDYLRHIKSRSQKGEAANE